MSNNPPTAFILAAGYGKRLFEITQTTPKALVQINKKPVISYVLERLAIAGIKDCVINLHYLKEQLKDEINDGSDFGINVIYSEEVELLNIAGGIANALDLISSDVFIVTNADVYAEYNYQELFKQIPNFNNLDAHFVLGNNPHYHPQGDFSIKNNLIVERSTDALTYIGTALYHKRLFQSIKPGTPAAINPLWNNAILQQRISAEIFNGYWIDVGDPKRLDLANKLARET